MDQMLQLLDQYKIWLAVGAALVIPGIIFYRTAWQRLIRPYNHHRTKKVIVDYVQSIQGPISSYDLAKNLRIDLSFARTLIHQLVAEGKLQRLDNPGGVDRVLYQIPDASAGPTA